MIVRTYTNEKNKIVDLIFITGADERDFIEANKLTRKVVEQRPDVCSGEMFDAILRYAGVDEATWYEGTDSFGVKWVWAMVNGLVVVEYKKYTDSTWTSDIDGSLILKLIHSEIPNIDEWLAVVLWVMGEGVDPNPVRTLETMVARHLNHRQ